MDLLASPQADDSGVKSERAEVVNTLTINDWSDAIRDTFVALDIDPEEREHFSGTVHTRKFAHLMAADVVSSPQVFKRTPHLLSEQPLDLLQMSLLVSGRAEVVQDGRTCILEPGDVTIFETSRSYEWSLHGDFHLRVFTWPRQSIALPDAESPRLTARAVRSDSAIGRLLTPMLSDLLVTDRILSASAAIRIADTVAELGIAAAEEESGSHEIDSPSRALYASIVRYIDHNLEDPDLSALTIAHAFFVSPRTVHRLFARYEKTVAIYVRARRLEVSRQRMLSPIHAGHSLTEISTQLGFVSLSVFSRAFATTYGISPSRYRQLNS